MPYRFTWATTTAAIAATAREPVWIQETAAPLHQAGRLLVHPRVTVRCRSEVTRLDGDDFLEEVSITDRTADTAQTQPCSGLIASVHKAIATLA